MVPARACIPERQFARLSRGTGRRKANHILAVYRLAAHQEVGLAADQLRRTTDVRCSPLEIRGRVRFVPKLVR
jgi:hypothetical protein